jgi:hypothetical protein
MSAEFVIPDWMVPADAPPPPPSPVDDHRVEALVNRFIAAKQDALFTGPDAYYRSKGRNAIKLLPFITDRLTGLKAEQFAHPLPDYPQSRGRIPIEQLIEPLTDGERATLDDRLDAHIADAMDGINRHVAAQREAFKRQTLAERQRLIRHAIELEHNNDDKLAGLAEAHASAALELARMNGEPEGPAIDAARSAIWHSAIAQRIANGDGAGALKLFQRARHQLNDGHILSLDTPLQVARQDQAADQWIARQAGTDGPPLTERLDADPDLPPETKDVIRAKVGARDSAEESKRVATIQALDDQVRAAYRAQVANPGAYKPGTFARLAEAYTAAGDLERAKGARRAAEWESFMLPFVQASAEKQQQMIDTLPPGEKRDHATGLRDLQAEFFERDSFAAGTAVYKEVGPPVPIDDIEGRVHQARQIATLRGGIPAMPFTARELGVMQRALARGSEVDKQAVQERLAKLPDDTHALVEARLAPPSSDTPATGTDTMRIEAAPWTGNDEQAGAGTDGPPAEPTATTTEGTGGFGGAAKPGPDPGSAEYQAADAEARRIVAEQAASGGQAGSFATESAPSSDVYRSAEAKAHSEEVKERVTTDRAISEWLAKAQPGQSMPSELVEGLSPDQKSQIEELASEVGASKTDPAVLDTIVNGLKSRNPETQRVWAQTPLYRYRSQLSASDFRKVVELQDDLDPETGYSRSEIAGIRQQLANRPDTSDLDWFYKALAADPDVQYGEILPIGVDRHGKIRWLVLPESARRFLKGFLDLLKGTKTGELTPEAIETFTGITGGAGRVFGPRGDGATFGAGGTRRPSSKAEKERRAVQVRVNNANGRAWEKNREAFYKKKGTPCTTQITIKTMKTGRRGRVDCLFYDENGRLWIKEFKVNSASYIRRKQREFFAALRDEGGTIVGKGKGAFRGGEPVPKTAVEIEYKSKADAGVNRPGQQD